MVQKSLRELASDICGISNPVIKSLGSYTLEYSRYRASLICKTFFGISIADLQVNPYFDGLVCIYAQDITSIASKVLLSDTFGPQKYVIARKGTAGVTYREYVWVVNIYGISLIILNQTIGTNDIYVASEYDYFADINMPVDLFIMIELEICKMLMRNIKEGSSEQAALAIRRNILGSRIGLPLGEYREL